MNEEKLNSLVSSEISFPSSLNRRTFLKRLGGGIVILFTSGNTIACAQENETTEDANQELPGFNAYLRIGEDGRVSCFTGKIEMGQGIVTSLGQMLADELDVSLDDVDMVMGDTDLCPWDMGTWGSLTTRVFGPQLRAAGAEARSVLFDLAAERLDTDKDQLQATNGVISVTDRPETRVTYAELTQGQQITRHLSGEAAVKSATQYRIMGNPENRRDAREKVTGQAKFAGDIRFPDMLYARILRPPAHGATLQRLDTTDAENVEGVQIVRDGDLIAVLHKYRDEADKALQRIDAFFDEPEPQVDDQTIFDHLLNVAPEGRAVADGGNLAEGEKGSTSTAEHTYLDGYVAHAPIEPHTAIARMENGRMTVWASTQNPFGVKDSVASTLDLAADNVRVIAPFVGGGFGGKASNQQALEAARLAKITGRPVQVAWSREEEFFFDTFRPAAVVKIKSGIDSEGRLIHWDYHVYFAGERGSQQFYSIPHHRTTVYNSSWVGPPGSHPFATGPWRAPAANSNSFARESQMDIMAAAAGIDPLDFRLNHLDNGKMTGVLRAAADQFGWAPSAAPSGRGYGVACGTDADTDVALMAEVEVDERTGAVRVKRVVAAQDMGLVVNPEGAKIQMEGCVTMGLGYTLSEDIHFNGGKILDLNFGSYKLPLFSWLPVIETVLVDSGDPEPHGGGEPAIICMGAVIANAIYDAVGIRLFQLPMTPERVLEAMG